MTGTPGRRDWYANVLANPAVQIRVRSEEYQGLARVVDDDEFRRRFFSHGPASWYATQSKLNSLVETAPMIEIELNPG